VCPYAWFCLNVFQIRYRKQVGFLVWSQNAVVIVSPVDAKRVPPSLSSPLLLEITVRLGLPGPVTLFPRGVHTLFSSSRLNGAYGAIQPTGAQTHEPWLARLWRYLLGDQYLSLEFSL